MVVVGPARTHVVRSAPTIHPTNLRAVARRHGGGCLTIRCCWGDMALSTWSTLRTSARRGGRQVLGYCLTMDTHDPPYEQTPIGIIGMGEGITLFGIVAAPAIHPTSRGS
jgi:hypothetical protein